MENWPIYLVTLLVHVLMLVSVYVSIYDCTVRASSEKLILYFFALIIPIFGPIFVHNRLKNYVKSRGVWIDVNSGSSYGYSDSRESGSSSGSSDSSCGGGD